MTASPRAPDPVKAFAAVLFREEEALAAALERLRAAMGEIDFAGPDRAFEASGYYEAEMGTGLLRRIVSFTRLAASESLVDMKLAATAVEDALRGPAGRRVNVDPGYLDVRKVVLASSKEGALKVHLGRGVFADVVLRYAKGRFEPLPWTFADFKTGAYDPDLVRIRELYKRDLHAVS